MNDGRLNFPLFAGQPWKLKLRPLNRSSLAIAGAHTLATALATDGGLARYEAEHRARVIPRLGLATRNLAARVWSSGL